MRPNLPQTTENTKGVHVFLVLIKAFRSTTRAIQVMLKGHCLGESDFRVLEVLLHKGPMPVNTIGPKVALTPGSISVAVDRLLKRGFVERGAHEGDRRVHMVSLTREGRKVIAAVFAEHERRIEYLLQELTQAERGTLVKLLKKMGKTVDFQVQRADGECAKARAAKNNARPAE